MFPPLFGCGGGACGPDSLRRHQQRKLTMLCFWRDGLERQLAAIDASISTLQQQIERDGMAESSN